MESSERKRSPRRILAYLGLALLCYPLAVFTGPGIAFLVFVTIGVIAELQFWREVIFGHRRPQSQPKTES